MTQATATAAATMSERMQEFARRTTMIRGKGAYGRKPKRSALKALSQYDPIDIHHFDETTGRTTIETVQNPTEIIKRNKALLNDDSHDGYNEERNMRHVANIPMIEITRLYNEQGINVLRGEHWPMFAALIDSPEWAHFRVSSGRVSSVPTRNYFVPPAARR